MSACMQVEDIEAFASWCITSQASAAVSGTDKVSQVARPDPWCMYLGVQTRLSTCSLDMLAAVGAHPQQTTDTSRGGCKDASSDLGQGHHPEMASGC